jgi:Protein of unknown function (DUF3489)
MAVTGWHEHSIGGFVAAVVKKQFGLHLASEKAYFDLPPLRAAA